ncbi:hypothetical protein [Streptomyces sp. NBC_01314]|uniref:hypothetical protein n=1 Tax=Streptomyces sp. NBC_01314 TaxID=2903821 RepID=UPI00309300C5|nr:hypothetical protein OG622_16350 [Streptomyces sp. NBC_01314]
MTQTYEKPPTMLSHVEPPYPVGTLVKDTLSKRTGELHGVIEERTKEGNKVISRTAFLRPEGGGTEWDVPLKHVRPVGNP